MNNLKRILSLALASVMLVGMMVVGASAAEFTDSETIANTDAVDTLVALNVIGGYDDGSFRPEGNVTRAQMAKMIAVAMNGGNEDFRGSSIGSQFVDVKDGQWYVKFINYCATKGIINGRDATHFDPEGMVTATETAVMVMRAMGYRNETFLNEKGTYSPAAVDALAEDIGLYNDTTELNDTSVALTRQNAAQVICNGIQTTTPEYTMSYNSEGVRTWTLKLDEKGQLTGKTMLEKNYKADIEYGILDDASYSSSTKKFTYNVDASAEKVSPFGGIAEGTDAGDATNALVTDVDATDLYMQRVKIVYSGELVLSITPAGNNVVSEGVIGTIKEGKNTAKTMVITLDGYRAVGTGDVNVNTLPVYEMLAGEYTGKNYTNYDSKHLYDEYRLIDNNGDSKLDCIIILPVNYGTVSYVGTTTVTINGLGSIKKEYCYDGIAVNDVAVDTYAGIVKAETVTGKIDGVRDNGQVRINNSWISSAAATNLTNTAMDGKDWTLTVVNGYYVAARQAEATAAGNMVFVINCVNHTTLDGTTYAARVLNTDGTIQDITITNNLTSSGKGLWYIATPNTAGTVFTLTAAASNNVDKVGFADMKSGNIFWDATAKALKNNATALNLADDAVVVVQHKDKTTTTSNTDAAEGDLVNLEKVTVLTGKEAKSWKTNLGTSSSNLNVAFTKTVNGIEYVTFLYIANKVNNLPNAVGDSTGYGYVLTSASAMYQETVGNRPAWVYDIWNGAETVTVHDVNTSKPTGKIVKYDVNPDGTIDTTATPTYAPAAVVGWNAEDGLLNFQKPADGTVVNAKVDKDTVYMYIDSSKGEGVSGGSVNVAAKDDAGAYYANAYLKLDETTLTLVVIDVNGSVSTDRAAVKPAGKGTSGSPVTLDTTNFPHNTVSKLNAGVTSDTAGSGLDFNNCNAEDVLVFSYKRPAGSEKAQKYTFKVGTITGGDQVYTEELTTTAASTADGFFWLDVTGVSNDGAGTWNLKNDDGTKKAMEAGKVYTWCVVGADGVTYASGTFKL